MEKSKLELVKTPVEIEETDSLTELLRIGAKALISKAVEAELAEMLSLHTDKLSHLWWQPSSEYICHHIL